MQLLISEKSIFAATFTVLTPRNLSIVLTIASDNDHSITGTEFQCRLSYSPRYKSPTVTRSSPSLHTPFNDNIDWHWLMHGNYVWEGNFDDRYIEWGRSGEGCFSLSLCRSDLLDLHISCRNHQLCHVAIIGCYECTQSNGLRIAESKLQST